MWRKGALREDGEESLSPKKSKGDVTDYEESAVGSEEVIVAPTPSPSHLATIDQIFSSFRGLSFPVPSSAELTTTDRSQQFLDSLGRV
ncbi:hypothetical protein A2U01_0077502, partial [Trifolium medium]|nr:hypothetical protein [Trifolium medium]